MRPYNDYSGLKTPIVLVLDDYEAANLHWLLRMALIPAGERKDLNLNTGDWNGQILWQLEDAIMDKVSIIKDIYDANPRLYKFQLPNEDYPKGSISIEQMLDLGTGRFR